MNGEEEDLSSCRGGGREGALGSPSAVAGSRGTGRIAKAPSDYEARNRRAERGGQQQAMIWLRSKRGREEP